MNFLPVFNTYTLCVKFHSVCKILHDISKFEESDPLIIFVILIAQHTTYLFYKNIVNKL